MSYLDRLRAAISGNPPTPGTAITAKSPFDSFGSTEGDHISADQPGYRWRVHRPGRPPLEVLFSPELTAAEVSRRYQDATSIEPLPEVSAPADARKEGEQ